MGKHVGPPNLSLCTKFDRNPSWCCLSYGSKCVYIQDGRQAAILNDIKNLFDVHNPQTIPDLGVKFQTI